MAWASGKKLQEGKYRIESTLGIGGFGITYLARDSVGNPIVVKTLNETAICDPRFEQFQQDFVNEAVRLAKCRHPHIVQVHRLFQEAGLWCMVMEYIAGEDLGQRVKQRGTLSEAEALHYMRQIGDALTFMHQNGWLHRDVKPENIMLRAGRAEAVLLDLGIAREFTPNSTQVHTAILSNGYAPIEQYESQARRGAYSDVYGLAATLYFVLTGEIPKDVQLRAYNLGRYHSDPLTPPQQLNPSISDRTSQAILSGMAVEAPDRPQSVAEWLQLLPDSPAMAVSAPRVFVQSDASVTPKIPPIHASASSPTRPELASRSNFATVAVQPGAAVSAPSQPFASRRSPVSRFLVVGSVVVSSVLAGSAAAIWYVQRQAQFDLASVAQLRDDGQYEQCIDRARAVSPSQPTYGGAQTLLNQCAEGILAQANQLAAQGQFQTALQEVAKIPADSAVTEAAENLKQQWSEQLFQQATQLYQTEGKLDEAIALLQTIPAATEVGAQAEQTIAGWQAEWNSNESTLQTAQQALDAGDWYAAKEKAAELTTPYWVAQGTDLAAEADAQIAAAEQQDAAAQEAEEAQDPDGVFLQAYEQCLASGGQDCQQFEELCRDRGGTFVADANYLDCRPQIESNKAPKPEEDASPKEESNSRRRRQLIIPGDR